MKNCVKNKNHNAQMYTDGIDGTRGVVSWLLDIRKGGSHSAGPTASLLACHLGARQPSISDVLTQRALGRVAPQLGMY